MRHLNSYKQIQQKLTFYHTVYQDILFLFKIFIFVKSNFIFNDVIENLYIKTVLLLFIENHN